MTSSDQTKMTELEHMSIVQISIYTGENRHNRWQPMVCGSLAKINSSNHSLVWNKL